MTVLDHVRPTVVVRRRIVDVTPPRAPLPESALEGEGEDEDEDDEAPPSSVFVHPGYLQAADEIESPESSGMPDHDGLELTTGAEREDAPSPPSPEPALAPAPSRREVSVPRDATVREVAKSVGVPAAGLVADLVGRGLFATTGRTPLSVETKRAIEDACEVTLLLTGPAPVAKAPAAKKKPTKSSVARSPVAKASPGKGKPAKSVRSRKAPAQRSRRR